MRLALLLALAFRPRLVARTAPGGQHPVDVLDLLIQQHNEAKSMFKQLEEAEGREAQQLYEQLHAALTLHEELEETYFYPELKRSPKAHDLVLEGYQEHHVMDVLQREIEDLKAGSEAWQPKIKVLQENTEHHIKEEEDELFPKVRQIWDAKKRAEVGQQMQAMITQRQGKQRKAA